MALKRHSLFRVIWWTANVFFAVSVATLIYASCWEYSVRQYLRGFSDAIVPLAAGPEQKLDAILTWMHSGPPRSVATDPSALSSRDPETTLNYQQLLSVCGSATNAFLNLSRSAGLNSRRLLLLTPQRTTKHVVAEVLLDGRWIVVDPTYRTILRDAKGHFLTRTDLRDPAIFAQATGSIPGYLSEYNFENVAHVRLARLPLQGLHLRPILDRIYPGWDESLDWSLLLERESFFVLFLAAIFTFVFLALRVALAWFADNRLQIPRFRLRDHLVRASSAFFTTPEIK